MNSIWMGDTVLPCFETMEGSRSTDVLIIGGGMAGILCAYFLQKKGVDYMLAEGRTICSGITKNTTAKITSQHGLIYAELLKNMGHEKAQMYLEANQNALRRYRELCERIDCDFEEKPAYVYSLGDRKKLEEEIRALEKIGFAAKLSETKELPFLTAGAVEFEKQAQFHPLKFIAAIVPHLNIYENTFVQELKPNVAVTKNGNINFRKIIFATHFPIDNKHGMYFLKMYQHRSYVIAYKNAERIHGMYIDEAMGGLSFRNYRDFLLIGGGSHRTGKTGGNWQAIRSFAGRHYPALSEKYFWATQDCMTLDKVPYIGRYSKGLCDCFVATGFNKWGMTSSMAAAEILTDMVMEKENPYSEVFDPSRSMLHPQLFFNGWEAAASLLTFSARRCPHLGCALKWNSAEHSWDCPCHGSRFDENGTVLDNPANKKGEKL